MAHRLGDIVPNMLLLKELQHSIEVSFPGVAKSGDECCCGANGPTTTFIPPLSNAHFLI